MRTHAFRCVSQSAVHLFHQSDDNCGNHAACRAADRFALVRRGVLSFFFCVCVFFFRTMIWFWCSFLFVSCESQLLIVIFIPRSCHCSFSCSLWYEAAMRTLPQNVERRSIDKQHYFTLTCLKSYRCGILILCCHRCLVWGLWECNMSL